MVQLKLDPIRNEKLFSRHYLEERLPESDTWGEDGEKIKKVFEEVKELYEKEKGKLKKYKEAQLEKNFIWKILDIINPYYEIRETTKSGDLEPDYGFFKNEKDLDNAHDLKEEEDFYKNVIAVGDAKRWGTPLDKQDKNAEERWDKTNPSYQIFVYLKETPADWGILTDGRYWRLYTAEEAQSLEVYYQVDLISILENENLEAFKYFYHFFRRKAFIRDESGKSFLDKVYTRSVRYAESVGKDLENRLYRALELMAKGYFDVKTNRIDEESLDKEKHLEIVHENSLIFLYRLIFVLYAEANGLLKSEKIPSEYDVNQIVEDALNDPALNVEHPDEVEETSALYDWRLNRIFKLIDQGSEEYEVPAYDGGLFDNNKYPFFKIRESDKEHNKIRNNYLAHVIKLLTKTEGGEGEGETRIDYADLSIKHIGGIYEGLLEHDLKIAEDSKMVCVNDEWIPLSDTERDFEDFDRNNRAEKGEIYLATDEGERKATGSYYTPEYIVGYIVENTLGPFIDERFEEIDKKYSPDEKPNKNQEAKREAILSLDVLDPAMGSAHFLVEATDFLAQKLSPYLREEELDDVDEKEHSDKTIAKRLVLKNCIYGVDINPLATELAKVSLWLTTIMSDKPLQFLSHHLKTGNSLVGADIDELATHPKNSGEKEKEGLKAFVKDRDSKDGIHEKMRKLIGVFKDLEEQREDERADINKEKEIYDKFLDSDFRVKFDILADVYTSYYFENNFSEKQYQRLLDAFKEGSEAWEEIIQEDWVRRATNSVENPKENNLSKEKSFFHWQLEFPDIFFDLETGKEEDNPGFDAVMGNPPWVFTRGKHFSQSKKDFFNSYLERRDVESVESGLNVQTGKINLYGLFYIKCIELQNEKSKFGFIVPNNILRSTPYAPIRRHILDETHIEKLINLGKNIFEGVTASTLITILEKPRSQEEIKIISNIRNLTSGDFKEHNLHQSFFKENVSCVFNILMTNKTAKISKKVRSRSVFLGEISKYIIEGIVGSKKRDIFQEKKDKNYKKFLDGHDIEGYGYEFKNRYIRYDRDKLHRARPKEVFESDKKIIIQRVSGGKQPITCHLDEDQFYTYASTNNLILKEEVDISEEYITTLLNSKLINWYYSLNFSNMSDLTVNISKSFLEKIPIRQNKDTSTLESTVEDLIENKKTQKNEKNSFLKWVSREWGVEIEDLSLKSSLKEYWKNSFDEILRIAKENKSKIDGDPSSRKFQEKLEEEWEKSKDAIRSPIKEIRDLENKIDVLVFDLYDLTEEEVETVLDSLDTPKEEKEDILEKFKEVKD